MYDEEYIPPLSYDLKTKSTVEEKSFPYSYVIAERHYIYPKIYQ